MLPKSERLAHPYRFALLLLLLAALFLSSLLVLIAALRIFFFTVLPTFIIVEKPIILVFIAPRLTLHRIDST